MSAPVAEADPARLSSAESKALSQMREGVALDTGDFIQRHPELQQIVTDFTKAVLEAKPQNVLEFAKDYFHSTPSSSK